MRNTKPSPTTLLALPAALLALTLSARAATLSYSTTAPTPGANDIYNLTGASHDAANVNDGGAYPTDGGANDAFTYVAMDRGAQGQTFLTGGNLGGYKVSAIWLQHASYSSNNSPNWWDATWYQVTAGATFKIRITNPSQTGSPGFVLNSETAVATGAEPNALPTATTYTTTGTGTWLRFGFDNPFALNANTGYGFDVSVPSGTTAFFETLGTASDAFAGGAAYSSGAGGSGGDNVLTGLVGDRVFLIELTPNSVPEPSVAALVLLGGVAGFIRRKQRAQK